MNPNLIEGFTRPADCFRAHPPTEQQFFQNSAVGWISTPSTTRTRNPPTARSWPTFRILRSLRSGGSHRYREFEGASLPRLALDRNATAHGPRERSEIVRPSPVPPKLRVVDPSAWENASKSAFAFRRDADSRVCTAKCRSRAGLRYVAPT